MNISWKTIEAFANFLTGAAHVSKYRSGSDLVRFFNQFELRFSGIGPTSRRTYVEEVVGDINGTDSLDSFFSAALDPREFFDSGYDSEDAKDYLNKYLVFDGYKMEKQGSGYIVVEIKGNMVALECDPIDFKSMNYNIIDEQVKKAKNKIGLGDYSGAITNARSLLEGILIEIEYRIIGEKNKYDGDLVKLYRRVMKQMNLEPARTDISETLKQILSGFISVVNGMAGLRNQAGDAHHSTYQPSEHHAMLAVNAVNTLSTFLLASYKYQAGKGLITSVRKAGDS